MDTAVAERTPKNGESLVALRDGVVYCVIAANADDADMTNVIYFCQKAIQEKVAQDIVVDISHSDGFTKKARQMWVDFLRDRRIRRVAFYGGDIYTETTVSFIVGAAGVTNCKIFQTRDEALAWING